MNETHFDAVGEVGLLARFRLCCLARVEVASLHGGVQALEARAVDDVEGVDDVAERLAHLAAMRVAHHRVQKHLLERALARELQAHHDHARDPEKEDVVAGLEERGGVEAREVGGLLWPRKHGEGEEAAREPRV